MKIKDKQISVEIAKSADQRRQGLMGRKSLGKNEGMLFVFDRSQILSFWMKNTLIPLSIGFFDSEKKLINVLKMHPPKSVMVKDAMLPRYSSSKPAKYALEMNIGWFESNGIVPGDVFEFLPD